MGARERNWGLVFGDPLGGWGIGTWASLKVPPLVGDFGTLGLGHGIGRGTGLGGEILLSSGRFFE